MARLVLRDQGEMLVHQVLRETGVWPEILVKTADQVRFVDLLVSLVLRETKEMSVFKVLLV